MAALSAVTSNLAMMIGEDRVFQDTIYQADGVTVQNISNWTISFTVFRYDSPSTVLITKTTAGGGVVLTNPTQGVLQITVAAADTASLYPNQYEFVVQRTDSGNVLNLTRGVLSLLQVG